MRPRRQSFSLLFAHLDDASAATTVLACRWRSFHPNSTREERALQAWIILVGVATRRQTIRYAALAQPMFHSKALRHMGPILGHIAAYCKENKHPDLNCIVVNTRGRAGSSIPRDSDRLREKVFDYRWYDFMPPSPIELKAAFDRAYPWSIQVNWAEGPRAPSGHTNESW